MKHVKIYTDGACLGNPGPGGWCCLLRFNGTEKVLQGREAHTTNNRMEIIAVLEGLKSLKEPCTVDVYSDSQYVLKGIKEWLPGWVRQGWVNSQKKPVANTDLWKAMLPLLDQHRLNLYWVKGHAGHPENEFCDQTARTEAEAARAG